MKTSAIALIGLAFLGASASGASEAAPRMKQTKKITLDDVVQNEDVAYASVPIRRGLTNFIIKVDDEKSCFSLLWDSVNSRDSWYPQSIDCLDKDQNKISSYKCKSGDNHPVCTRG